MTRVLFIIVYAFFLLLNSHLVVAQDCCIQQTFVINDNFSTTINIDVSGIILDDLSDPDQGLCAIEIAFEHGAIAQLEASIFSPSGQSVQFIGASGVNNEITQNIYWDISFIQKSEIAEPDPGQQAGWTNEATWPLFPSTNTGSYYPFMDCLEDLNVGPVNGTWQIIFQDVLQTQVGQIDSIKLIFCQADNVNCETCQDGELDVTLNISDIGCDGQFGTASIESDENFIDYQWEGPGAYQSNEILPVIFTPGEYFVTLTSDAGCEHIDSFMVDWEDGITDIVYQDLAFACGQNQGEFFISGDTSLWSFEWLGPEGFNSTAANPLITELGVYSVIMAANDMSCTLSFSLEAFQADGPTINLSTSGDINCLEELVIISLEVEGDLNGNPNWTGPAAFNLIDPFTIEVDQPGWYEVSVLDLGGCEAIDSVFVDNLVVFPTVVIGQDVETFVNCLNNGVELEAFASGDGVSISWEDEAGNTLPGSNPIVTEAGWYYAIAENDQNCTAIDSIEIEVDTLKPIIDFFVFMGGELTCLVDSVRIDVFIDSPNVFPELNWTGPNSFGSDQDIIIVYEPGTYVLSVVDANGCESVDSVIITSAQDPPAIDPLEDVTLNCSMPSQFLFYDGLSPFAECTWETDTGPISMDCELLVSTEGTYYFSVTNFQGCTAYDTINVFTSNDQPQLEFLYDDLPLTDISQVFLDCDTDSIVLSFNSDIPINSVTWTLPDANMSDEFSVAAYTEGSYSYSMVAENGCLATGSLQIYLDTLPPVFEVSLDTLNCLNDSVFIELLTGVEELSFIWSGPETLEDDVNAQWVETEGFYSITVTNLETACSTDTIVEVIADFTEPQLSLDADDIPCSGEFIAIDVQSNLEAEFVQWSGPNFMTNELEPLVNEAGWYFIDFTALNGCMVRDSILISQNVDLPVFSIALDTLSCDQESVNICAIDAEDDFGIEWLDASGNSIGDNICQDIFSAGMYTLIVIAQNACSDSLEFEILEEEPSAEFSFTVELTNSSCDEGLTITVSTDDILDPSFLWSTNDGEILGSVLDSESINALQTGTYLVNVQDNANGCTYQDSVMIDFVPDPLTSVDLTITDPSCTEPDSGVITVNEVIGGESPFSYSLTSSSEEGPSFEGLSAQLYELTITDQNGCNLIEIVELFEEDDFSVDLGEDIVVAEGETYLVEAIIMNALIDELSFEWSGSLTSPCLDCLDFSSSSLSSGFYVITVQHENGCISSDTLNVFVEQEKVSIDLPNIFSPDGDGQNDTFGLYPYSTVNEIVQFNIYDRWGNLIFNVENGDPENPASSWDGRFNGQSVQAGVYVYMIEVLLVDNTTTFKKGSLTLLR